jgi:endonuclease/exonuclease/phosphatase family metal-dependent hydrolase
MIRIFTLNLWKNEGDFPNRLTHVREGLELLQPDIVCFQEVYQDSNNNALECIKTAMLPSCVHLPERKKVRDGILSSSGLAIVSRFEIKESSSIQLPSSAADGGRSVLLTDLATPFGPLRILNVHLSHLRGIKGSTLRAEQWAECLNWAYANWHDPVLICGDFNDRIDAPWIHQGFGQAPFETSASFLSGQTSLRTHPDALIDHIVLVQAPDLVVKNSRIFFTQAPPVSDHYGVLLEVGRRNKSTVSALGK